MKNYFHASAPAFNAEGINATIQRALASAGLDTRSGLMRDVTDTIRRALASGGPEDAQPGTDAGASVIDVTARIVDAPDGVIHRVDRKPPDAGTQTRGTFETLQFSNAAGTRAYKLYVPLRIAESPPPMVVMLHGCTQSASDFAAGTRMNRLAEEHGFLVLYPEQGANSNASKCWNWFQGQDQVRDSGEPSLLAGMVRDVAARHGVDRRRIFVAGLSAGAAMAVILGETYPELFAGVGAHSGLPYASAHDIPSAMAAMKGGRGLSGLAGIPGAANATRKKAAHAVPVIVFHGDRDHTVQQTNGAAIVQQATDAHVSGPEKVTLHSSTQRATSPGGRSYSRTIQADDAGLPRIESWTLHGAGHAWSGGDASGSYTDGTGPDASAEMVRFFLALPRAGTA
jgi:poly(hydroxyalkanoate) depolymerase family esterase